MLNLRQRCFIALLLVLFLSLPFQSAVAAGFLTAPRIPTGPNVTSRLNGASRFVAVGDFNHDGKLDFVVANPDHDDFDPFPINDHSEVSVLLGNGNGTFRPVVTYPAGEDPFSAVVADFNGDGNLDVVVANGLGGTISILLGNGDGTFRPPVSYLALVLEPSNPSQQLRSLTIGDFNGDGKPDLALATAGGGTYVTVLLGNGDGTFQPPKGFATGSIFASQAESAVVGDFNGDGKLDLALTATDGMGFNGIHILLGNGDGTFHAGISMNKASGALAVADFNGDGKLDLAAAAGFSGFSGIAILLGNGDGTFQSPSKVLLERAPGSIVVADINGDGKPDLAFVQTFRENAAGVVLGNGDGTFQDASYLVAGRDTSTVAVGDFNGDHLPDLVAVNGGIVNDASLFLGNGDGTFAAANSFNANADLPVSSTVSFVTGFTAIGDLNNDGKPDLITSSFPINSNNGFVGVQLGNGNGTFQPARHFPTGGSTGPIALGDFNGDGKLDLAAVNLVTDQNPNSDVSVLLGNGDGTLQAPFPYSAGQSPRDVVAADFNGDGKLDLAVANNTGVSILLGRGDGTFHSPINSATPFVPTCLAAADLNGDGKRDLVFVESHLNQFLVPEATLGILLGNGNGSFQPAVTLLDLQEAGFGCPVLADLNHDGKLDLVVPANGLMGLPSFLVVLLGNGDGTFPSVHSFDAKVPATLGDNNSHTISAVAVADVNGDGKPDLVATTSDYVSVLPGNGDGSFQSPLFYDAGYLPGFLALADFNGDGAPDVAAGAGDGVTILLNTLLAGTASHLSVFTPRTSTAGSAFSTTVTAKDGLNLTVANYAGTVSFSSTDAKAALPSGATLPGGFGVFNVNLKTAGNQTVTATDRGNGAITGTSRNIAVSSAGANHYTVAAPASATAGTVFSLTVTGLDPFNNTATGYLGTVHFASSDGQAALPANYTFLAGDSGVHTFMNLTTLKTAGNQTVTATDQGNGAITGTSGNIAVDAAAANHYTVTAPASATAGTVFSLIISALDQFNNIAESYRGTVQFASSDGRAVLPANYMFVAGDSGVHTFTNLTTLKTAGVQAVIAGDSLGLWGSSSVLVSPDATARLIVNTPPRVVTGAPFGVTVAAQDQFSNATPTYQGTVQFTTSAGSATLPGNYTFSDSDLGVHSFPGTVLVTTGNQTITATDTTGAINGTSGSIDVTGSTPTTASLSSSINPAWFRQSITLTATVAPVSATGTVTFMDGTTLLGRSTIDNNGNAALTLRGLPAGVHAISAIYDGDATYSFSTSAPLMQNRPPAPRKLPNP